MRRGGLRWWHAVVVVVAAIAGVAAGVATTDDGDDDASASRLDRAALGDADVGTVGAIARAALSGDPSPGAAVRATEGEVFAVLRSGGRRVASDWAFGRPMAANVDRAVRTARDEAKDADRAGIDVIELAITRSYRPFDLEGGDELPGAVHRGVRGIELRFGDAVGRYAPTHMLATNRDFDDVLKTFRDAHGIGDEELDEVRARTFDADQILVPVDPARAPTRMFRGNEVVPVADVTATSVEATADLMTAWLFANVRADGRMTYAYWPSVGDESSANNMIRQWMATVALMRGIGDDAGRREIASRNLAYNLRTFYREEQDGLGVIDFDGEVKLGAVALAALAIVESPERSRYGREEAALRKTVDRLWHDDGRFDTFLRPADRQGENQNFYPGEALVLWSTLWRESRAPALLDRYMRSFEWYRRWHLDPENRNPAFVPWHTQAHVGVWRETRDQALASFVFEMNDWLLSMQQWDDVRYDDLQGRFYDPDRPQFGPPHASSTGVYLEGLVDAYDLAVEVGDADRAGRYRQAIVRGMRSIMQLQFVDDADLFYVSQRDRALGGIRTEVYDNVVRVDNVQHNLMGFRKILATFEPADYRP